MSASMAFAQNATVKESISGSTVTEPISGSSDATMKKLQDFKSTGAHAMVSIPQSGDKAEAIKKNLEAIKLPPGFKISLYALVPDARMIAVGPQGVVTYVSTRKTKIYTLTDRGHIGRAEDVREFAPTIPFNNPNAICFSKDGFLFSVEQNRVLIFPAAEFFYENPDVAVGIVVEQGGLIPPSEESFNHSGRVCRVGSDNKLYIALGQPYNVYAPEKYDLYYKFGLGGIIRMDRDGSNREVFAHGIRNSVGMDFNPKDKTPCGLPTTKSTAWGTTSLLVNSTMPPSRARTSDSPGTAAAIPGRLNTKIRLLQPMSSSPSSRKHPTRPTSA
jgi:glucose/arabinose dehydrogenase